MTETISAVCSNCGEAIDHPVSLAGKAYCEDCAENLTVCFACNTVHDTGDYHSADDGETYCQDCYDETFCHCVNCGCELLQSEAQCQDGASRCDDCHNERYTTCEHCGEVIDRNSCYTSENGEDYCESCYSDIYCHCSDCENEICNDDAICVNGRSYCEDCAPHSDNWEPGHFSHDGVATILGSARCFGIELETSSCPDHTEIDGETIFGCKDDSSIDGKEFISPILSGDSGLAAIDKFCRVANRHGFEVDNSCGYHLHIDARDMSTEQRQKVAFAYWATEKLWGRFVPTSRRKNSYCGPIEWQVGVLLTDLSMVVRNYRRYCWLNLAALSDHRTIEIRLHTSTLDADKVTNWVKAHLRFVEWAMTQTIERIERVFTGTLQQQFNALCGIWGDDSLSEFYADRAHKWGTTFAVRGQEQVCLEHDANEQYTPESQEVA